MLPSPSIYRPWASRGIATRTEPPEGCCFDCSCGGAYWASGRVGGGVSLARWEHSRLAGSSRRGAEGG
jgi:hypothetical protein